MLRDRLSLLRQQSGMSKPDLGRPAIPTSLAHPPATGVADQASLRDLERIRKRRLLPMADDELAELVGGQVAAKGLILIEQTRESPVAWGKWPAKAAVRRLPEMRNADCDDWVFLDTETTGLAGGTGTTAFLVGLARLFEGRVQLKLFLLAGFAGEAEMLKRVAAELDGAGLVTYNGKRFDMPLLATRGRLMGVRELAAERPHLDLLYTVRRAFGSRWSDCRLATAESRLLGVRREADLPGAEAPAAWRAHLQRGDASALPGVVGHNLQDIVSLVGLTRRLAAIYDQPENWGADISAVAKAWQRFDAAPQSRKILERNLKKLDPPGRLLLADLYRRQDRLDAAVELWEGLARQGETEALLELAKYHEHVQGDPLRAREFARALPEDEQRAGRLLRLDYKINPTSSLHLPLEESLAAEPA